MARGYIVIFEYFLIMPNSVKAVILAMAILTLFLLFLFIYVIKRVVSMASKAALPATPVNKRYACAIKEVEAAGDTSGATRYPGGLLAAASRLSLSGNDVIYEQNGIPYINAALARKNNHGTLDSSFVRLVESVTNAACSGTAEQALEGS